MRWCVMALCACILMVTNGCRSVSSSSDVGQGQLVFQKDSATCADTVNTELYIDGLSQGQYTMHPGSIVGFTRSAVTHIAQATERAGKLRQFPSETVAVPDGGAGYYVMTCSSKPPPGTPPSPSPAGR